MAKNSSNYGLTLNYPGVETIEGTLVSVTAVGVNFISRKAGSSTKLNQFYPAERVIAVVGKEGSDAQLSFMSEHIPLFRSGKRGKERPILVTGVAPLGNNLLQTRSDEFPTIIVNAKYAQFSGEEKDENAPSRGRKAGGGKAKAKSEGSGKKAKATKGKAAKGDDWE